MKSVAYAACGMGGNVYLYVRHDAARDIHVRSRRQRQMCIRDR
ncbi:hypothetical protein CDFC105_43955 [Clostridioides difficile]|nr:hypothetical protein CDFC105_43955 [Clostridioides difficile]